MVLWFKARREKPRHEKDPGALVSIFLAKQCAYAVINTRGQHVGHSYYSFTFPSTYNSNMCQSGYFLVGHWTRMLQAACFTFREIFDNK